MKDTTTIKREAARSRRISLLGACLLVPLITGLLATPGSKAANIVSTNEIIEIEVQKGSILRLDRDAETVFVADPEVADVSTRSKRTIFVFGLETGETTIYALDKDDQPILSGLLRVNHNTVSLENIIKEVAPDSSISVRSVPGGVIVEGTVQTPKTANEVSQLVTQYIGEEEQVLNRVAVMAPTQVNLRVQIVEASREVARALGVHWEAAAETGGWSFGLVTGRPPFELSADPTTGVINYSSGSTDISSIIDALETEGVVSVLAEPNLTAISGETASFLAGGEFPVPVNSEDNKIEVAFKEFGVSLAFTPTVLTTNRISLHVRPEVSQLSESASVTIGGITIPGLTTRRAETTVELGSGQSFAVAGLLSNRTTNDLNKVPGLGSIPVLGKLFQSRRFQEEETELVIVVTPYLVRPTNPVDKPLVPVHKENSTAISQFEQMLDQRTSGGASGGTPSSSNDSNTSGSMGFIME